MAKKRYRLWALAYTTEAVEAATRQRFSRVGTEYVLIYTTKKPALPCAEVTDDEIHRLTGSETQWLADCNTTLIFEETAKKGPEIMRSVSEKLDALEAALKRQKQIETGEGDTENGETN
jgi:hypothetical protein